MVATGTQHQVLTIDQKVEVSVPKIETEDHEPEGQVVLSWYRRASVLPERVIELGIESRRSGFSSWASRPYGDDPTRQGLTGLRHYRDHGRR